VGFFCWLGRHRAKPEPGWNGGYYISECRRCGVTLVRPAFGPWVAMRGFRVVRRAKPALMRDRFPLPVAGPRPNREARIDPGTARSPTAVAVNSISGLSEKPAPDARSTPELGAAHGVPTETAREEASSGPGMISPSSSPTVDLSRVSRIASSAPIPDFMDDGEESAWDCLMHSAGEQPNLGHGTAGRSDTAKRDAGDVLGQGVAGARIPD
jgi:hypothetical protein